MTKSLVLFAQELLEKVTIRHCGFQYRLPSAVLQVTINGVIDSSWILPDALQSCYAFVKETARRSLVNGVQLNHYHDLFGILDLTVRVVGSRHFDQGRGQYQVLHFTLGDAADCLRKQTACCDHPLDCLNRHQRTSWYGFHQISSVIHAESFCPLWPYFHWLGMNSSSSKQTRPKDDYYYFASSNDRCYAERRNCHSWRHLHRHQTCGRTVVDGWEN